MTRKHFIALAAAIRKAHDDTEAKGTGTGPLLTLAREVAELCEKDNKLFDRMRFMAACGF